MLRGLHEYHRWANRRLWDVAAALPAGVPERPLGAPWSYPTLKDMFAHIYGADRYWLARWQGDTTAEPLDGRAVPTLAALREPWDALERAQQAFLAGLEEAVLDRIIDYRNLAGRPFRLPLGDLLLHVVIHATHHRSEIATMLTVVSGSPPDSGYHTFRRLSTGQGE